MKNFIKNYYKLFDETLSNWSVIVLIIAFLVAWVWNSLYESDEVNNYVKTNTLESSIKIIEFDWKKYKIIN